jgi:hypothetical protein
MSSTLSFRPKDHWYSSTSYSSDASHSTTGYIMPTRSADQHLNKRQINQSHITDFFSSNLSDYDASVDSSLLSVGMRIRKAVPEGYKTHKTAPVSQAAHQVRPLFPVVYPSQRSNELTPFCGIHKVGGLGIQNSMESELGGMSFFQGGPVDSLGLLNQIDAPFSSQESNYSIAASDTVRDEPFGRSGGKRRLDFGEDGSDVENDISMSMSMGTQNRNIAKPRSRRRVHQSVPVFSTDITMDFEEASFLIPSDDMEFSGL